MFGFRHIQKSVLGITMLLGFATTGFTSCEDFNTVTVPQSDTQRPMLGTKVLIDGDTTLLLPGMSAKVTNPNTAVVVAPGAIDSGGLKKLSYTSEVVALCLSTTSSLAQRINVTRVPQEETQAGEPGSTVSNGIYLLDTFKMRDYGEWCSDGFELAAVEVRWSYRAEDFHGNTASGTGTLNYRK